MNPWRIVGVVFGIVFLAVIAAVFYQTGAAGDARERAEALSSLRLEAATLARTLSIEAKEARELADSIVREAERDRHDADLEIRLLRARNRAVTSEAARTGQGMLEAVRALEGDSLAVSSANLEVLVLAHLEDDQEVVRGHDLEREQWLRALEAEEAMSDAFQMRAIAAEVALDASELACRICEQEAEAWRDAASPGWFTRLRQSVPSMLLAAGATALLLIL